MSGLVRQEIPTTNDQFFSLGGAIFLSQARLKVFRDWLQFGKKKICF